MLGRGYQCYGYNGFGIGNSLLTQWIFIIAAIIIIGIVIYLVKKSFSHHSSAIEALKMKYVNGEITEEEYMTKKQNLQK